MTGTGVTSESVLTIVAAATVFAVMFTVGLNVVFREFRWVLRYPGVLARALFAVLVAVPAVALVVCRALELPRLADIGIVLMAISPGAPVALRNSLGAGGHRAFAPALQITVALLAVASMPLSIAALNVVYAGQAIIAPSEVARQVFVAQLIPLALGMAVRHAATRFAMRLEPVLARISSVLLVLLVALAVIDAWHVVIDSSARIVVAIVTVTAFALAIGHMLGGPDPATRTAVAISSAARNPGLALLVATLNNAPPEIGRTVVAYLVVSACTVIPYVYQRRRAAVSA